MIKPLNNNCLIEVLDEYAGVIRNTENENVQKGVLRDYSIAVDHLTVSTGYHIDDFIETQDLLNKLQDKTVYWQEYADAGSKFTIDGKNYVLIPFYRLTGFEE